MLNKVRRSKEDEIILKILGWLLIYGIIGSFSLFLILNIKWVENYFSSNDVELFNYFRIFVFLTFLFSIIINLPYYFLFYLFFRKYISNKIIYTILQVILSIILIIISLITTFFYLIFIISFILKK